MENNGIEQQLLLTPQVDGFEWAEMSVEQLKRELAKYEKAGDPNAAKRLRYLIKARAK